MTPEQKEIRNFLRSLGWTIEQEGPHIGEWVKLDTNGNVIARQQDDTFGHDVKTYHFKKEQGEL